MRLACVVGVDVAGKPAMLTAGLVPYGDAKTKWDSFGHSPPTGYVSVALCEPVKKLRADVPVTAPDALKKSTK